jgi:toxin ParE1/3/4
MSVRNLAIRLTRTAERDLENIALYTRQSWGGKQHASYRTAIDQAFSMLAEHPRSGRSRDDVFPGCRSIRVEQHIIYYHQPKVTEIVVRRILHYRQDASAEVQEPPS